MYYRMKKNNNRCIQWNIKLIYIADFLEYNITLLTLWREKTDKIILNTKWYQRISDQLLESYVNASSHRLNLCSSMMKYITTNFWKITSVKWVNDIICKRSILQNEFSAFLNGSWYTSWKPHRPLYYSCFNWTLINYLLYLMQRNSNISFFLRIYDDA